ncbi:unnamed protein product [Urochloa humidicola]
MAQRYGPPFDFDLNESPPEDDDIASEASPARAPEPVHAPSPRDLLPPSPQDTLPSPQHDTLAPPAPAPAPEPSTRDPLPAPAPAPESSSHDPLPSPVLDLDAPLSSLDDDYYDEEYDDGYDEADLPPPPPLPPHGLVPVAAAPARSSSSMDTPGALPPYHRQEPFVGDAAAAVAARPSSPEKSAPRGISSGTASSHRSRRRSRYSSYDPRDDDAISKQRRVGSYDDEDAGSSRSGSRRSDLASPPHYEQGVGRHVPAAHGQPGAPTRNNRRRRPRRTQKPPQQGYEYPGQIQKQQQGRRGWEQPQGLRGGQERLQAHQGYGPHGPEETKVGYSSYGPPLTGSYSYKDGRQGPEPEQERHFYGNGMYHHQRREAPPPPPPSSRPRGREDPYYGRRSQAQGPPKIGGYQHSREGASLRPGSGAHGRDGSSGGRPRPAEQPVNGGRSYQQRKAPRGGERFPDRAYHPYARGGGGALDGAYGDHQGRREPPHNYHQHRRDNKQRPSGPARVGQYYGD